MTKDELIAFGRRVKKIRKHLRISQREFGENLGLSGSFLSEVETGKVKPGFGFFKNAHLKYHVNFDYLFTGEGEIFTTLNPENVEKTTIDLEDFGKESIIIEDMLEHFQLSPFVRYNMLQHYKILMYERTELILDDIEKTLAKKKEKEKEDG